MSVQGIYHNDEGSVVCHSATATVDGLTLEMDYVLRLDIRDGRVVSALSVPTDQRAVDRFWSR